MPATDGAMPFAARCLRKSAAPPDMLYARGGRSSRALRYATLLLIAIDDMRMLWRAAPMFMFTICVPRAAMRRCLSPCACYAPRYAAAMPSILPAQRSLP